MQTTQENRLEKHILFEYTSFDSVVLRGYVKRLFVEGAVIYLLRNLGFNNHGNGVMRILTDKLNSHININCRKDWCKNTLVRWARKEHQVEFLEVLLSSSNRVFGFRNKDLKQILGENWKTAKIAYSPHEMRSNFWFTRIISRGKLRKLRERGAVKKIQSSHCYQLTKEGYVWVFTRSSILSI